MPFVVTIKFAFIKTISDFAAMFIRKVQKKNEGSLKRYTYYRLVESYRSTAGKPRQRMVLSLGTLDGLAPGKHKLLADRIEALLLGQPEMFPENADSQVDALAAGFYREILQTGDHPWPAPSRPKAPEMAERDLVEVDMNTLQHEDVREVGSEWLCKQVLDSTGLAGLLEGVGIRGEALANCLIAALSRLAHPASELATQAWLRDRTALTELCGMRDSHVTRHHLYKASCRLYEHKDLIEKHLSQHSRDLFSLDDKIILFDLTNTYFEGRMSGSEKAAHGRSKEKRSDARLISLALIADHLGFPKCSRLYAGNIGEPGTLKEVLAQLTPLLEGERKPVVVIDAGIATAENLALLKELGYDYLCVSRTKVRDYDASTEDATVLENKQGDRITVKDLPADKETGDRLLYVRSPLKAKKDAAIKDKRTLRFEADMEAAKAALSKKTGTKALDKVHQRIGRIKERHSSVAKDYRIEVVPAKDKPEAADITWSRAADIKSPDQGVYFLRTSRQDLSPEAVWRMYSTLTEIESAFRTLKTDLSIRPVHHQTDKNIEAHLFLGILAYHVVAIIRHTLKQHGIRHSWRKILSIMDSQKLVTTTFVDAKGQRRFIRQCSRPTAKAKEIYDALGLKHQPFTRKKGVVTQL